MQATFRQRASQGIHSPGRGRFFDQRAIPVLLELNSALLCGTADDERELAGNCERLVRLAPLIRRLLSNEPVVGRDDEFELLGDLRSRFG